MNQPPEQIAGVISEARQKGNEVDLLFTNWRVIVAVMGKDALTGSTAFGLAGMAAHAIQAKKKREEYQQMNIEQMLASGKKNFFIPYTEINSVLVKKGWGDANITIDFNDPQKNKPKKLKWNFKKDQREYIENVLKGLIPAKMV